MSHEPWISFSGCQQVCCRSMVLCRNYPIMQKHFENNDIIVQKKEIGPGWVNSFIVLTDSNGKMYVWRFCWERDGLLRWNWCSSCDFERYNHQRHEMPHMTFWSSTSQYGALFWEGLIPLVSQRCLLTDRQEAATKISDIGGAIWSQGIFGVSP